MIYEFKKKNGIENYQGKALMIAKLGNPVLYKKSQYIDPTSEEAKQLAADMIETIQEIGSCAGLAAPQVHISKRMCFYRISTVKTHPLYKITPEFDPEGVPLTILINPKYEPVDDRIIEGWEGCLSAPDLVGIVPRFHSIKCSAYDLQGQVVEKVVHGFHAVVMQHEVDHLDGIVYPMRMKEQSKLSYLKEAMLSRELQS